MKCLALFCVLLCGCDLSKEEKSTVSAVTADCAISDPEIKVTLKYYVAAPSASGCGEIDQECSAPKVFPKSRLKDLIADYPDCSWSTQIENVYVLDCLRPCMFAGVISCPRPSPTPGGSGGYGYGPGLINGNTLTCPVVPDTERNTCEWKVKGNE